MMNGHSVLILYVGLAGVTGVSLIAGANADWVILILLTLNGALTYTSIRVAGKVGEMKGELVGIRVTLFGAHGTGGLFADVTDKEHGLLRSRIEQAQAIRVLLEQQRAVIRALAQCQSQGEVSVRMRPYLPAVEEQALELEARLRALELSPFVRAE